MYKYRYFIVAAAVFILASITIVESCILNYIQIIKEADYDIEKSDEIRNIRITQEQCGRLFYYTNTGKNERQILGLNEKELKKTVYDNIYRTLTKDEKRSNYLFRLLIQNIKNYNEVKEMSNKFDRVYQVYKKLVCDARYFPVAKKSGLSNQSKNKDGVSFEDSWNKPRSYGGDRQHEGTDIMSDTNIRGEYPVVSICDGIIEKKGWLELGGYRIGIRSNSGAYYYYAHLAEYADNINEGVAVKAGDVIGTMGDTGYSKIEGTTGNFDVHLHFGMYTGSEDDELSFNPYGLLKSLERSKKTFKEYASVKFYSDNGK